MGVTDLIFELVRLIIRYIILLSFSLNLALFIQKTYSGGISRCYWADKDGYAIPSSWLTITNSKKSIRLRDIWFNLVHSIGSYTNKLQILLILSNIFPSFFWIWKSHVIFLKITHNVPGCTSIKFIEKN